MKNKINNNLAQFREAGLGLFIHFGLYALIGGEYKGKINIGNAEWIMNDLDIPVEEYEKLAAKFDPIEFDADEIVRKAKEDWGMKYIVFTSKHHDGFALFDSKASDYNSMKASPCKRDFVKELQIACEKYGLGLGLYYSQAQDWHDPDGLAYTKDNSRKDYQAYLERKCYPQLRELLTNYGDISLIWFDTPLETTYEQSLEMKNLVKSLQPNCLVNGRIGHSLGDYATTGDNAIPKLAFEDDWEVPATLNDTWGFSKVDQKWKTPQEIVKLLVKINSRGGNYLLNIGPEPTGKIPTKSIEILDEVGKYVKENADAIYATDRVPFYAYETTWGDLTCKKHKLFIHVYEPKKVVQLLNMDGNIRSAYILKDGIKLDFYSKRSCEKDWMLRFELPESMYNDKYYCICAELEEEYPIMETIRRLSDC